MLFLREGFVRDARDLKFGIDAVRALKKRYGNTITTTLWRYVEQSKDPVFGAISCHPHRTPADFDEANPFRYFVGSLSFQERFSNVRADDLFSEIRAYCEDRRGGPLGATDLLLQDDAGHRLLFHVETFFNQYEALTLSVYKQAKALLVTAGA